MLPRLHHCPGHLPLILQQEELPAGDTWLEEGQPSSSGCVFVHVVGGDAFRDLASPRLGQGGYVAGALAAGEIWEKAEAAEM